MSYNVETTRIFEREAKSLLKKYAFLKIELKVPGKELEKKPNKEMCIYFLFTIKAKEMQFPTKEIKDILDFDIN